MNHKAKILIVEDEILIGDTIKSYLENANYDVLEIAISYQEAIKIIDTESPDLVLLDIRLNGAKTGIDVGTYLGQLKEKIPHIYLSSQTDREHLDKAKSTLPEAFLTKPIQKLTLLMTIEVVLHKEKQLVENDDEFITFKENENNHKIAVKDILYINAEHVYLRIHIINGRNIMIRNSLKWIIDQLPQSNFLQVHRSYVVNIYKVKKWNTNTLTVDEISVPISRGRKKETLSRLEKINNGYTHHS